MAGRGAVGRGRARHGEGCSAAGCASRGVSQCGWARRGAARRGRAGLGGAGLGKGSMTKGVCKMFDENEAMTGEHIPFGSGQPTQPDVDELIKKWPPSAIKPGEWKASDTEIGAVFGSPSETRYKTVCAAWGSTSTR